MAPLPHQLRSLLIKRGNTAQLGAMVGQTFNLGTQNRKSPSIPDAHGLAVSPSASCSFSQDPLDSHFLEGGSLMGYRLLLVSLSHSGDPEVCCYTAGLVPTKQGSE